MAPEVGSFAHLMLFQYHNLVSFIAFTFGLILFVVSLQEGFYSYQFKRLGWTLLSTFCIVIGCSGLIIVLWRNRLWFFYALTCVSVHNAVDYFFCHFFPRKTPIMMLKPEASMEGFAAGSIACFVYFFVVSSIFS